MEIGTDVQGSGRTVAVFGAAGHTGRFITAELLRRGFSPVAIGRDAGSWRRRDSQRAVLRPGHGSVDDAASLDRALMGADARNQLRGAVYGHSRPIWRPAALRARIHYLDVSAEQASAQSVFDRFGDAAREAGVTFIPAMGFYGGFADLLATAAMGDWESADEIRVGIALDSWHPTEGTRITGRRNTARRLVIEDGKLVPLEQPAPQTMWDFAEPFGRQDVSEVPFSEVPVIARHIEVARLRTISTMPLYVTFAIRPLSASGCG